MNIMKGKLNKKEMCRFLGLKSIESKKEIDKTLDLWSNRGYISYEKIGRKYSFILFGKPVTEAKPIMEMTLGNDPK